MGVLGPAKDLAADILASLGQDFTLPVPDLSGPAFQLPSSEDNPLYAELESPSIEDLTTGVVGGTGAFDRIMSSHKAHLQEQFEKGRITGDQYVKAYVELTAGALAGGLQMVLQGNSAHWQATLIQLQARKAEIEAVTASVQLEIAKAQLYMTNRQAELTNAQYVLTAMQIANEDAKYELSHAQLHLIEEQTEAQRAQTLDTRSDDEPVTGMLGKQKDLYSQQIVSYQRDSEQKAAKMFLDSWITQKTLDEGLTAPLALTNPTLQTVMSKIQENNGLTTP